MAYVEIKDFKDGLDTRRPAIVGEPGTLIECVNAHITRGGDVESRKDFPVNFSLPASTFGMHGGNNKLYIFGSAAAPTNLPGHIVYQRLQHPSASAMTALLSAENFDGKVYAVAEYADGSIYHFYDGARVTDWDTKATAIADDYTVATYLGDKADAASELIANVSGLDITITAAVAGTAFTISKATTGTGSITLTTIQANLAATAEVRATASFQITGGFAEEDNAIDVIQAGATDLIDDPVPWVLSNAATALACVIAINNGTADHGYSASASGATVTITGPAGEGATANGRVLTVTPSNAFVTVGSVNNFASGVTAVAAKPQVEKATIGGTFAVTNTYKLTLNSVEYLITGLASGMPRTVRTFGTKMHNGVRALDIFSAVDDPTAVSSGTGIGSINISSQDQGSQRITAFGVYQNLFGIFTRDTVQVWFMDPDPLNNAFRQLLQNTGTDAPRAVLGYGNSDLMYLSDTGIRSLRARDSSNAAFVDDIGTRIDSNVIEFLATLTDAERQAACGVVDPTDGRAWIAIKNRIYVFSYFPGSKVSAWSYYEPGFTVDWMAVAQRKIYLRADDTIYAYGPDYPDDDDMDITVQLPFIDANRVAENKQIQGVDIVCSGEWTIELLVDPRDESLKTAALQISGPTTLLYRIPVFANTTHFAPLLTSSKGGRHTLSGVVVHFEGIETD